MRSLRASFKAVLLLFLGVTSYLCMLACDLVGMKRSSTKALMKRKFQQSVMAVCNIRIKKEGEMVRGPALLIGNHVSYCDVNVIWASAQHDIIFTPKISVKRWPAIGALVSRFDVVFVDRTPTKTKETQALLQEELHAGKVICIFAEATTGDGRSMLPFKSSLFNLAEQWNGAEPLPVQPVSIIYEAVDGKPMDDQNWPRVAWYGNADFFRHFWTFLGNARIDVRIHYHPATALQQGETRKQLSARCEAAVKSANPHYHIVAPVVQHEHEHVA